MDASDLGTALSDPSSLDPSGAVASKRSPDPTSDTSDVSPDLVRKTFYDELFPRSRDEILAARASGSSPKCIFEIKVFIHHILM